MLDFSARPPHDCPMDHQAIIERIRAAEKAGKTPALAYLRVSTGKQEEDGLSLDDQAWHAAKYADRAGLVIVHAFSQSESARKEGRKNFNAMLALAKDLGVKTLLFKSTDRMSRNYTDLVQIEKLIRNEGYRVHFFGSGRELHSGSSHYDFAMLGIEQTMAKARSDENSQYSRANNEWKDRQGIAPGPPRYGYRYDRARKSHVQKEPEIHTLRFIFDRLRHGGHTLGSLCDELNALGHRAPRGGRWSDQILHKIVVNPFYHGDYWYRGQVRKGVHDPVISREDHQAIIRALNLRLPRRTEGRAFRLQNLVRCPCGLRMYGDIKKGRYTYYVHSCRRSGRLEAVREERLIELFDAAMRGIELNDSIKDELAAVFREVLSDQRSTAEADARAIQNRISVLRARKEKAWEMYYVADAPKDDIAEQLNRINAEIRALEEKKLEVFEHSDDLLLRIVRILDDVWELPRIYRAADADGRAMILRNAIESATLADGALSIKWSGHFGIILRPELLEVRGRPVMGGWREEPRTRAYVEYVIHSVRRLAA